MRIDSGPRKAALNPISTRFAAVAVLAWSLAALVGCPQQLGGRPADCVYEGTPYQEGAVFASKDGDQQCRCAQGAVLCVTPTNQAVSQPAAEAVGPSGCGGACPDGQYCAYPLGSCGQGRPGTCEAKAEMCMEIYQPVCGCDGKTYSSTCHAAAAGVSVRQAGECGGGAGVK